MNELLAFLNHLEEAKIFYRLSKVREAVMVEIAVPGQRWEVEFFEDGHIEVEKFISNGHIQNGGELEVLFRDFSD